MLVMLILVQSLPMLQVMIMTSLSPNALVLLRLTANTAGAILVAALVT